MPVRLLMADGENRGIQAYRWFVSLGMACVGYFAWDTRVVMQDSSSKLNALTVQVSTLSATVESRFGAQADRLRSIDDRNAQQMRSVDDRNNQQDARMDKLADKLEALARLIYQGFGTQRREPTP